MNTLYADLNARTEDDRIRLDWDASIAALASLNPRSGDWLWIGDQDLRVGAQLEVIDGSWVARPAWDTAEDVIEPTELSDKEKQTAKEQLGLAIDQPEQALLSQVLHLLPRASSLLVPGFAASLRAQALARAGYPDLALLSFDEAIRRDPQRAGYRWHRIRLLANVDLPAAILEADQEIPRLSSILMLDACVGVLTSQARQLSSIEDRDKVLSRLLDISENLDRFTDDADRSGAVISILVARGFAQLARGDRDAAAREFTSAIAAEDIASNGDVAEAYAARGATGYPSRGAVVDLTAAADRGSKAFVPYYYLAHHYLTLRDWRAVREHALRALSLQPTVAAAARLHEWLAIVDIELDGSVAAARSELGKALSLLPSSVSIQQNLEIVNSLGTERRNHAAWSYDIEDVLHLLPAFIVGSVKLHAAGALPSQGPHS